MRAGGERAARSACSFDDDLAHHPDELRLALDGGELRVLVTRVDQESRAACGDLQPLAVGLARFNALYSQEPTLIQAAAILAMALPVVVFFLAQRAFMRGVVFGGVEK